MDSIKLHNVMKTIPTTVYVTVVDERRVEVYKGMGNGMVNPVIANCEVTEVVPTNANRILIIIYS